jgi:hypothetical protein
MSVKNRRLYRLIERIRRDEADVDFENEQEMRAFAAKHGLRHEEDVLKYVYLEGILADFYKGIPPSDDDIPVVMEALRDIVLSKTRGRLRKSQQAQDDAAGFKAEANELYKEQREAGRDPDPAWRNVVEEMKRRHPGDPALKVNPRNDREEWQVLRDRWYGR